MLGLFSTLGTTLVVCFSVLPAFLRTDISPFDGYRLQHTDVDVPHFSDDNHSFVKGALHTIDRPYDKLDPWGAIDFLHHKIGTTHVAHHFDSSMPHYKAQAATDAIKEAYPHLYLYDPTPIPQALWRVAKGCTSVQKRDGAWIWDNKGVEDQVEA